MYLIRNNGLGNECVQVTKRCMVTDTDRFLFTNITE